jgi:hypothetical protein
MNLDVQPIVKNSSTNRTVAANSQRAMLLFSCLLVMMFARDPGPNGPRLLALVVATVMTGVALFRPLHVRDLYSLRRAEQALVAVLVLAGLIFSATVLARPIADQASPLWFAVVSAYTILGFAGAFPVIRRLPDLKWAFWLFLATHVALTVVFLRATPAAIDVQVFLRDGANALLHGHNPYSMTFPNIYPPPLAELFYGPGVVVDGRVTYGFPYLPFGLLSSIPGYLLGDVRYSQLIAMLVTALVLRRLASDRTGRALAILAIAAPTALPTLTGAWTEPALVAILAGLVLVLRRRRNPFIAVLLGLLLVSKQYVVIAIPVIWLIRRWLTRRAILVALGVAAALTLPFFLVNPAAFWKAIVEFQLIQPFRADSLSLLVSSVNTFGWPPPWTYGLLPLVGGGLTAIALALRAPRTPAAFAAGVGLTLLVTILLSKQAFMNYYFIVSGALLIATVAWPSQQAVTPPEQGHVVQPLHRED